MEERRIIQVEEKVPLNLLIPLSIQHMFAMFGASVLVPFVFGINPAVVLFMNGVGTLLFILVTKGKGAGLLRLQLCLPGAGHAGYQQSGHGVCLRPGRLCGRGLHRLHSFLCYL